MFSRLGILGCALYSTVRYCSDSLVLLRRQRPSGPVPQPWSWSLWFLSHVRGTATHFRDICIAGVACAQYAINAMTVAAFYCDTSTAACAAGDAQGCPCPRLTDYNAGAYVWDFFRDSRSLRAHTPGLDWLFLVCFCIGCRLAALAALKLLKHNQSPTYK